MACKYNLSILFVDPKDHKRAILASKRAGLHGATVIYGRGTISNKILAALGMDSLRKELLLFVGHNNLTEALHREIDSELHLEKRDHGVLITLPLARAMGLTELDAECWKGETSMDYELITIIVDNGRGDDIIDAAQAAGATGATVLHGRGSGAENVEKFFSLEIEPEKELVMIIVNGKQATDIIAAIRSVIDFDAPNSGILFSLDASKVTGLFEPKN